MPAPRKMSARKDPAMLFLIIGLTGATGLFYYASLTKNRGFVWIDRLCGETVFLCDRPNWLLALLCIVVVIGMLRTMGRA